MKQITHTQQILMSKINRSSTANKWLKDLGIEERIMQGRGHVYFYDGDASAWYSSSIPVRYVSSLSVRDVLYFWLTLKTYNTDFEVHSVGSSKDAMEVVSKKSEIYNQVVFESDNIINVVRYIQAQNLNR